MLALLDVGRTPVSLALKPDGGELMVCDFDSDSISIIETANDEVGSSVLIGQHPARGLVTLDNSRLYVSNFGSDSVAVYDIDLGKRIATMPVGSHPEGLALSQDQRLSSGAGYASGRRDRDSEAHGAKTGAHGVFAAYHDPRWLQPNGIVVKVIHGQQARHPMK